MSFLATNNESVRLLVLLYIRHGICGMHVHIRVYIIYYQSQPL